MLIGHLDHLWLSVGSDLLPILKNKPSVFLLLSFESLHWIFGASPGSRVVCGLLLLAWGAGLSVPPSHMGGFRPHLVGFNPSIVLWIVSELLAEPKITEIFFQNVYAFVSYIRSMTRFYSFSGKVVRFRSRVVLWFPFAICPHTTRSRAPRLGAAVPSPAVVSDP